MIFEKIIEIVTAVEAVELQNLKSLNLSQSSQKLLVVVFQNRVHKKLEQEFPDMDWRSAHKFTQERGDEVDIYGRFSSEHGDRTVIMQLDSSRADQVAKEFVSKFASTLRHP